MTTLFKSNQPKKAGLVSLMRDVAANTGIPKRTVRPVLLALVDVMTAHLASGKSVSMEGFGRFTFWFRRGRTIPLGERKGFHGRIMPPCVSKQPDMWLVRFYPAQRLKDLVRHHQHPEPPTFEYGITTQVPLPASGKTPSNVTRIGRRRGTSTRTQDSGLGQAPLEVDLAAQPGGSGGERDRRLDSAGTSASGDAITLDSGANTADTKGLPKLSQR